MRACPSSKFRHTHKQNQIELINFLVCFCLFNFRRVARGWENKSNKQNQAWTANKRGANDVRSFSSSIGGDWRWRWVMIKCHKRKISLHLFFDFSRSTMCRFIVFIFKIDEITPWYRMREKQFPFRNRYLSNFENLWLQPNNTRTLSHTHTYLLCVRKYRRQLLALELSEVLTGTLTWIYFVDMCFD